MELNKEVLQFLSSKLVKYGGKMPLQSLTGHLSQLPANVRESFGTSLPNLVKFLKQHPTLFEIDNNGSVQLCQREEQTPVIANENFPSEIVDGKGIINRIFPQYGFMKAFIPVKASVYFSALHFNDKTKTLLHECGVAEGDILGFNAKRGPSNSEAKYRATKVWICEAKDRSCFNMESSTSGGAPSRRKIRTNIDNGLYDTMKCSGEGEIQNVFNKHGFIMIEGNPKNTIFFSVKHISNCENIMDLTTVLAIGDKVEYNAIRSTKTDTKVRWEATQVWIKSTSKNVLHDLGDEVFKSSSDSSVCNSDNEKIRHKVTRFKVNNPVIKKNELIHQNLVVSASKNNACISKLSNQLGKIFSRANNRAIIKFGENDRDLAIIKPGKLFMYGSPVTDIAWEVRNGDSVYFDAVKDDRSPEWEAVLAWVGSKPEVPSEITSTKLDNPAVQRVVQTMESILPESDKSKHVMNENLKAKTAIKVDLNTQRSNVKSNEASFANWGDSPFIEDSIPCGTDEWTTEKTHERDVQNSSKFLKKNTLDLTTACENEKSINGMTINVIQEEAAMSSETSCFSTNKAEIARRGQDVLPDIENNKEPEGINNDKSNDMNSLQTGIYPFEHLCGTIKSVHNIYGEFDSAKLIKPIVFNLNDLFIDGVSVKQNCKEVKNFLKVGESIFSSGFEIIDDSKYIWQKATLVWRGEKPNGIKQATPDEFIQELNLTVTLSASDNVSMANEKLSLNKDSTTPIKTDSLKCFSTSSSLSSSSDDLNSVKISSTRFNGGGTDKNKPPSDLFTDESNQKQEHMEDIKKVSDLLMDFYQENNDSQHFKKNIAELSSKIVQSLFGNEQPMCELCFSNKSKRDEISQPDVCSSVHTEPETASNSLIQEKSTKYSPRMCSVGIQTFSTGDILSVEIFPH